MSTEGADFATGVPGYPDLDSPRLQVSFRLFAEVLCDRPLESFAECNEIIGTTLGVATGIVRLVMNDLSNLGYLRITAQHGAEMTERGTAAALAAGILPA
jgi:hypothetical protein